MKTIKVSEATDIQLDWAVCVCLGLTPVMRHTYMKAKAEANNYTGDLAWHLGHQSNHPITVSSDEVTCPVPRYSTDWAQGGPILSDNRISRTIDHSGLWLAYWTDGYGEGDDANNWMHCDRSELVAGLRCFVESKLGKTVAIPEELL